MLLQDGPSKGNQPTVKVLEIAQNQDRKADDLLPYLSPFARFFRTLPNKAKDLILKTAFVPLNDIECFTRTDIDIPESVQNLTKMKGKFLVTKPKWKLLKRSFRYPEAGPRPVPAIMPVLELPRLGRA